MFIVVFVAIETTSEPYKPHLDCRKLQLDHFLFVRVYFLSSLTPAVFL